MSKRKKRRLKKKIKIFLCIFAIVILLFIILFIFKKDKKSNNINKVSKKLSINEVLDKINNKDIDKSFLEWYRDNYDLKKLNDYLEKNEYNDNLWHKLSGNSLIVLKDLYKDIYKDMNNVSVIKDKKEEYSLSFVGDVSLADNWYIMPEYDKRGKKVYGIMDKEVVDIMTGSDVMVANSEFTVSDRGEKMPGKYYTFRASPKRLTIYHEMGVDLVTLANNHVYDFGSVAFNDMLAAFKEYKIPYIGAGKNLSEASLPYYFIVDGYKIGFVNASRAEKLILTPGATDSSEGVFRCYDTTNFVNTIRETKKNSDYVIALIHWGKEDSHDLEKVQIDTSKEYIEAGADVIVGSHAHVLQGMEYYNDKLIVYNLGDFIFNHETKDTGIFKIKINDNGDMSYYFIPCLEKDKYTSILKDSEKDRVIDEMISWSNNIDIASDGKINKKN